MHTVTAIEKCRISKSRNLISVLHLGEHALSGVFPKSRDEEVTRGPLELVWCADSGLLQLKHSYDLKEMYGMNYGYRSGLNSSMVRHLEGKIGQLLRIKPVRAGDSVLDIGSNDGTTLRAYNVPRLLRVGVDPTGTKFKDFYNDGLDLIPDFFSADLVKRRYPGKAAEIITSIAMFYDLEDPRTFVQNVADVLAPDGIWHFEQSYMPSMLRMNAYDTVCHEHLEYYSLAVVNGLLEECGLKILDVQMNGINGGSFAVTATRKESGLVANKRMVEWLLEQEEHLRLDTPKPFRQFEERVFQHRDSLISLVKMLKADGKKVLGYGASTKGNVLLQFCGFTTSELPYIAEVNPDKYGRLTPGSHIPIISEAEAKKMKPDYLLVLPWHFKDNIVQREQEFIRGGGKLIFPLPEIEII